MKPMKMMEVFPDDDTTLGAKICGDFVHFGYRASSGNVPALLLYKKGSRNPIGEPIPFCSPFSHDSLYTMKVYLPHAQDFEYNFLDGEKIVTDPYARLLSGREIPGEYPEIYPHGLRARITDGFYRWGCDLYPCIPYHEAIMYYLHVRGFTMDPHSGVSKKGTFAALKKKIPYLKSLGINQVLLMPVYEFSEIELPDVPFCDLQKETVERQVKDQKANYWGYGKGYYFALKSSYASSDRADLEFKDLVRALHANKIEILLEFSFTDDTDIGTIISCLTFWAREYHIDGFSVLGRDALFDELARLPLFQDRKLICRYFSESCLADNSRTLNHQIACCNDGFQNDCRRALKGDPGSIEAFNFRIRQNPNGCAQINTITGHDGFTLTDLVSYNMKHNEANGQMGLDGSDCNLSWNCGVEGPSKKRSVQRLRMQQRKNAFAMLLLSQGTPMLLSGDEFDNSQKGNNNPWCQDNALAWLSWNRSASASELTKYVRSLTAFRRAHPVLHMEHEPQCVDTLALGYPDLSYHGDCAWYTKNAQTVLHTGMLYNGAYAGEEDFLYIAWNFHWDEQTFALPILPKGFLWFRVMDTSRRESFPGEPSEEKIDDSLLFAVPARTVVILEGRKNERTESTSDHSQKNSRSS